SFLECSLQTLLINFKKYHSNPTQPSKKMKNTILIVFCLIGFSAFAQLASVQGHVVSENGKGVPMATIQLIEIAKGTQADDHGKFRLQQIAPGNYTMQISSIGYQTITQQIEVATNQ